MTAVWWGDNRQMDEKDGTAYAWQANIVFNGIKQNKLDIGQVLKPQGALGFSLWS